MQKQLFSIFQTYRLGFKKGQKMASDFQILEIYYCFGGWH